MKTKVRFDRSVSYLAAAAAMAWGAAASGQVAPETQSAEGVAQAQRQTEGQAVAANQPGMAAATGGANEIIVTAQFREQNLQDTPLAITAVSAEMLEARSQTDLAQVARQAPNVSLAPAGQSFGASLIASIRGVGQG